MLNKHKGFARFMRQLDGKGETTDDYFSSTESLGRRLSEGAMFLVQFMRAECSWSTYLSEIRGFSLEERSTLVYARTEVAGVHELTREVGLHIENPSAYRKAIEYLLSHPACQRQTRDEGITEFERTGSNTEDYNVISGYDIYYPR